MQQNTILQQAINSGIKSNIDRALLCGSPHFYKTNEQKEKRLIHSLKYGSFHVLCHHGYFDIIAHFMTKHDYADKYIFDGALNSIISGKSDCAIKLLTIMHEKNIDINAKFGILLNNTVCSHFTDNNTNDLILVKTLINFGAKTSCCVTHPLINAVKKSTISVVDFLFNRQISLAPDHIDYVKTEQLEKIVTSMIRYATKIQDYDMLNHVKSIAKTCINDIYSIDYIVLKKKIQQKQPDLNEFAIALAQEDEIFFIKTNTIGLKNEEFIKLRELIKLNHKLYNIASNFEEEKNPIKKKKI